MVSSKAKNFRRRLKRTKSRNHNKDRPVRRYGGTSGCGYYHSKTWPPCELYFLPPQPVHCFDCQAYLDDTVTYQEERRAEHQQFLKSIPWSGGTIQQKRRRNVNIRSHCRNGHEFCYAKKYPIDRCYFTNDRKRLYRRRVRDRCRRSDRVSKFERCQV